MVTMGELRGSKPTEHNIHMRNKLAGRWAAFRAALPEAHEPFAFPTAPEAPEVPAQATPPPTRPASTEMPPPPPRTPREALGKRPGTFNELNIDPAFQRRKV